MALSDEVMRIGAAAAAHAAAGQTVSAVLAVEAADGDRLFLCAFADPEEWLVLAADGSPVTSRERVREAASIAALVEIAEEATERDAEEPRLASLPYLDSLGAGSNIASALPAVEELMRDVEKNYKLPLR